MDNNNGDIGIGYEMIIGQIMIAKTELISNFKHNVFKWDGYEVLMK